MANIMRTGGGLVEMGIIPDDYMLQATSMGYTFGGFDGRRIPLVEKKKVSVSVKAQDWVETASFNTTSEKTANYVKIQVWKDGGYNNQHKAHGRAYFTGGTFNSADQLIWLGTDYEALKQKTSGEIVVWLEPTN